MVTAYTKRGGKSYGYYRSSKAKHKGAKECEIRQVPLGDLETVVIGYIRKFIETPEVIGRVYDRVQEDLPEHYGLLKIKEHIGDFDTFWGNLTSKERHRIAELLIKKVRVHPHEIAIDMRLDGFKTVADAITKGKENGQSFYE